MKRGATDRDVRVVQACYPQIYLACHVRHQRAASSPHKLSARDASLLAHLDERTPVSPAALARHVGVVPSTLSAALDRLARLGYIARAPHPRDRRRLELTLTSKGADALRGGSVLEAERVALLLARLSPAERADALHGIALLARAARELADATPARTRR